MIGKMAATITTIGNALIDAFMVIEKNNHYTHIDKENHTLCFTYGRKIHVEKCDFMLGGDACNVGVGTARLGLKTCFMAEIGDDDFSSKIIRLLRLEPLDLSLLLQTKNAASSFAVGINYGEDRTLFVEHVERTHVFAIDKVQSDWVYLTSLGREWKHVYNEIVAKARSGLFRLALSPGTHQLDASYEEVGNAIAACEVLVANKDEGILLAKYYGQKSVSDIKELCLLLSSLGPRIISITDGENGSYAYTAKTQELYHIKRFPAQIVERTGAGDGYAAGFMAALLHEQPLSEAMRWGALNASSVITHVGSQPGLLRKEELAQKLVNNPDFVAEKL